jgi:hypothetical protein
MAALPGRTLEPLANYIRLRDPAPARFRLNVRYQWLRQSYRESLHETSVLHLWQMCKTSQVKIRITRNENRVVYSGVIRQKYILLPIVTRPYERREAVCLCASTLAPKKN